MIDLIKKQFDEHKTVVDSCKVFILNDVERAAKLIIESFKAGKRLYACGNGGSTCDAMHLVEELVAQYKNRRPPLPAHNLMDPSIMTCWSNDEGYYDIFRRQIEAYGREGDVLIAISTSGNSENVGRAMEQAKKQGMKVITFMGKTGGSMKGGADVDLIIPSHVTARIQEMHILIIHTLLELIDKEVHGV